MLAGKKDADTTRAIPAGDEHSRNPNRRRCICLSLTVTILAVALLILILALTVFKFKKPVTTVNSIALKDLNVSVNLLSPGLSLNITLYLNISIKNPNKVGLKYRNTSAFLRYKGRDIGVVPIPAGKISSGDTKQLNLTFTVFGDRLLTQFNIYADVITGNVPVSTYTKISGKVRVLNLFNIHVRSVSTCNLNIDVLSQRIANQSCHYKNIL